MSASNGLAPFACGLATAIVLVATIFLAPDLVHAQDLRAPDGQAKDRDAKDRDARDRDARDLDARDRAPDRPLGAKPSQSQPGHPTGDNTGSGGTGSGNPGSGRPPEPQPESRRLWPRPKFAGAQPDTQPYIQPGTPSGSRSTAPPEAGARLDDRDEIAALEAVHLALTEVGDGSTYVWHGRSGRLSGVVTPTASFKDASGKVCRHIVVALSADSYSRSTEGVACRLGNGGWQLEG